MFKCFKRINPVNRLKNNYAKYVQTQNSPMTSVKNSKELWPCFKNVVDFPNKIALRDTVGSYSYANVFLSAKELSEEIRKTMLGKTNERILFMCPNNVNYVITLWAIWMSGQIAVPLSHLHPQNLLMYYTNDTRPSMLITSPKYKEIVHRLLKNTNVPLLVLDEKLNLNCAQKTFSENENFDVEANTNSTDALILYTSGTTGNPKGVVLSHKNLSFQVNTLLEAWKWAPNDVFLHTLPLNHVHGLVNALLCPLTIGAKTILLKKFDANTVWSYLLGIHSKPDDRKVNVYMAVPTIYHKLIDEYVRVFSLDEKMVEYIKNTLKNKVRLMVSGSAPLPKKIYEKWLEISGHELLERYGMTEIGMCLSNLYEGKRLPGYVGTPLPGVSVRISHKNSENNRETLFEVSNCNGKLHVDFKNNDRNSNISGDLLVKSDGVFEEYFGRPEATKSSFTSDGYFITGDISEYNVCENAFKLLGRDNVDIIKTGGYKLSALEIETELMNNEDIKECAVVGIPDEEWGEKVVAIVVLNKKENDEILTIDELKNWAEDKLPKYSVPSVLKIVESIPRNTMGKVNKKELIKSVINV